MLEYLDYPWYKHGTKKLVSFEQVPPYITHRRKISILVQPRERSLAVVRWLF